MSTVPSSHSVAVPLTLHEAAQRHLLRPDGQEDLCFGLWNPSEGRTRLTALVSQLILPQERERRVHGNVSFMPSYLERAMTVAMKARSGLVFMHSHLGPGWQGMSFDDVRAEHSMAASVFGSTGLPLVGMTLGTDGAWSARTWIKTGPHQYDRRWCASVRVVGRRLEMTYMDQLVPPPVVGEELDRTVSAWGDRKQAQLARLRVGVVGVGSVGEIVAEALVRMGVAHVTLIDPDKFKRVNLDRSLHGTRNHLSPQRSKVSMVAEALRLHATVQSATILEVETSVADEDGYRAALDCDLLFSCVDRPLGRSVLNHIAYAHLIPVVDGGIRVRVGKSGQMIGADWKAHIASPERACLECLKQYDPGLVAVERSGLLEDPKYIDGLPKDHVLRASENVFPFSLNLASLEVLQMLMLVINPIGISDVGQQVYHFVPGLMDPPAFSQCTDSCLFPEMIGKGERTGLVVTTPLAAATDPDRMVGGQE